MIVLANSTHDVCNLCWLCLYSGYSRGPARTDGRLRQTRGSARCDSLSVQHVTHTLFIGVTLRRDDGADSAAVVPAHCGLLLLRCLLPLLCC